MTNTSHAADLRDSAGKSKGRAIAACAFALLAVGFVYWQLHTPSTASDIGRAFFSVDDGKTWFTDELSRVPPFDKDGKAAVRAYVYRGADGKEFVGYLQRFTADARRTIEQSRKPDPNRKGPVDPGSLRDAFTIGREVKRPGDAEWVSGAEPQKVVKIVAAKAGGVATAVEP